MSESIAAHAEGSFREHKDVIGISSRPAYQAYQILHITFAVVPIVTGLDKFFHLLCNWDLYLAPFIARLSPIGGHNLMLVSCPGDFISADATCGVGIGPAERLG
jgi:hypothetical protein